MKPYSGVDLPRILQPLANNTIRYKRPYMYKVVDLFSGAGGMSYGFHSHKSFQLVGAADAEIGKPSTGQGKLQCNSTYEKNMGISPQPINLAEVSPAQIGTQLGLGRNPSIEVLSVCPPCTGFSRANPNNHLIDDMRNSLVRRAAEFAVSLNASIVVMENARELIQGNFSYHFEWFTEHLENNGYRVHGQNYTLTRFGLPQIRERAIVTAVRKEFPLRTIEDLWAGYEISDKALTVRRAFERLDPASSGADLWPSFSRDSNVARRLSAIPKNGGSWADLLAHSECNELLTDSMKRNVESGRLGSYPDVYGRMAWDKPAPTIKRECSHIGNGRYAHPTMNRLCTVREMAILQGFPNDFRFNSTAISNMYRHIGDAVPPLLSYQLAHLCDWILSDKQPMVADVVLEGTSLSKNDIRQTEKRVECQQSLLI